MLVCRGDDLISVLWEVAFSEPPPEIASPDERWTSDVEGWLEQTSSRCGSGYRAYLGGMLHKAVNNWAASNALLESARARGLSQTLLASLYLAIGNNHRDLGLLVDARAALGEARRHARDTRALSQEARILNTLGMIAEDERLHDQALEHCSSALALAESSRDREIEGKCHGNIGIALKNKGGEERLARAVYHHLRALAIARELGDKRSEGRCLGNLGIALSDYGQRDVAQVYYSNARGVAEDLGDRLHVAIWSHNAGEDAAADDPDTAVGLLREALSIFRALGQESSAAVSEEALAQVLLRRSPTGS